MNIKNVDLVDLASGYWKSFAIGTALELNIFSELSEREQDIESLSKSISCAPLHLEALLNSLCGMGLLDKKKNHFFLHPDQKAYLDPRSPDNMLGAFAFNQDLAGLWMKLPGCIRSGEPVLPDNPHLGSDPDRTRRFVEGMHSRAGLMARNLLPCLHPPGGSKVLDVGGGPGTFSLKLAERDPSLEITVLDLPPVVKAAAEIHAGNPALGCITFQGGDYHHCDYPRNQDTLLYCGALHQEPDEGLDALLEKMKAALKPGGQLVVVDLMLNPDRCTPVYSALFELNMMLMRPHSKVHTSRELTQRLEHCGFRDLCVSDIPHTPYRMVQGTK
ncbi:methyltransferase [Kiritimatiellaeota bacterium B1221]|nr:methyltransferase [Kiritimatiellaeota bacterium B1221]